MESSRAAQGSSTAAAALLDDALEAHGGTERWRGASTIRAHVRSGGLLIRTRVPGTRFADYELTVDVAEPRAVLDPFPREGQRGMFDHGAARIESQAGETIESRADPRPAFFGRSGLRRNLRWDALDSAYFAGYAMWNYVTSPYLLTREGVQVRESEPWHEDGEVWRRLEATFPSGIDTHSRAQTFYFDSSGLLRRHDYVAQVVGGWAHAAHYSGEHTEAGGLVFPTRRRVRPIGPRNRSLPFPTLVWIELGDIYVDA